MARRRPVSGRGRQYRCTQCRTENDHTWSEDEYRAALNPISKEIPKTTLVPCRSCGSDTVQNELGR